MFTLNLSEVITKLRTELEEKKSEEKKKDEEEKSKDKGRGKSSWSKAKGKTKGQEDSDISADQTEFHEFNGVMYRWWKNAKEEWFWQDQKDLSKWTKFQGKF